MQEDKSSDSKQADGGQAINQSKRRFANICGSMGQIGLALGFGSAVGFWIADRGVRWFPTMLSLLMVVLGISLVLIISGKTVEGTAFKPGANGPRIRRRMILCVSLLVAIIVSNFGINKTQQPCPLTQLGSTKFDEVFKSDLENYRQYDAAIERLLKPLENNAQMFDPNSDRVLNVDEEKLLRDAWTSIYDYAFATDQIRVFYEDWYRFDPSRAQRSFHLRSFLLTFAAELTLYEKGTKLAKLISSNPNAAKFLDAPYPAAGLKEDSFSRFREQYQGARDLARVLAGEQYLLWLDTAFQSRRDARALGCDWLWDKIELEIALINAQDGQQLAELTIESDLQLLKRSVKRAWYPAQKGIAKWMGDTRVKRVGVYLIKPEQLGQMDMKLEPGDILVSRKNWHLSNVGLPGFWPHAILYIGKPEKLETYFDDPDVKNYLRQLTGKEMSLARYLQMKYPTGWFKYKSGYSGTSYRVIEAISEGIVLNTLNKAAGDYLGAMRPRLDKKAKAQAIIEAFSHLGKPYDYEFDFATDHALVCTEVIWRCYRPAQNKKGLNFKLLDIAGRKTLPANEIARLFAKEHGKDDRQLDFVYFLDASEKAMKAFVSTEEAFQTSHTRFKWDLALD